MRRKSLTAALVAAVFATPALAAPVLMTGDWGKDACVAWNRDPVLTDKLVESGWVKNDKGRGFKVMQIYRSDCPDSARIELRVSEKGGKAVCTYGGKAETKVDTSADYMMWAETRRWIEMGKGEYGPMRAMMFNRLTFDGPMGEAMGNMGPFEGFLLLVGKVPGDTKACPAK